MAPELKAGSVQWKDHHHLHHPVGRSAGGKDEEGKFPRVPGTNPFFPRDMADMGNRMLELLDGPLNTGRVGGHR